MNPKEKARLAKTLATLKVLLTELESLQSAEADKFDSLSEKAQETEAGQNLNANAEELQDACDQVANAISVLKDLEP